MARTILETTIRHLKSCSSHIATNLRRRALLRPQRLNRRKTLFHATNIPGRSRDGEPARAIESPVSTNVQLLRPDEPHMRSSSIIIDTRSHCSSLRTRRLRNAQICFQEPPLSMICPPLRAPGVLTPLYLLHSIALNRLHFGAYCSGDLFSDDLFSDGFLGISIYLPYRTN